MSKPVRILFPAQNLNTSNAKVFSVLYGWHFLVSQKKLILMHRSFISPLNLLMVYEHKRFKHNKPGATNYIILNV